MKHLDDQTAISLAETSLAGTGLGEAADTLRDAQRHAEVCRRCRDLVEQYQRLLGAVESAQALSEEPPAWVQRWAAAYARTATATPRRRWLVLPLLAQTTGVVAAVRGGGMAGTAYLYGDESHHLDLRIEPAERGRSCLHGQLLQMGSDGETPWSIAVVTPNGETIRTTTSETGEFWLEGADSWQRATVIASTAGERLVARLGEGASATVE